LFIFEIATCDFFRNSRIWAQPRLSAVVEFGEIAEEILASRE
tara:strand:- start:78 stop:203 length:126 start_codon:yes stop_codon:yes gene_type:complete